MEMNELWITFIDQNGEDQRLLIDKDEFIIGRHTGADLCFPDSRLSREHVRIEKIDGEYIANDCGSTNGTLLNGNDLEEPTSLRNGDELDLGGGLRITAEISKDELNDQESPSGVDDVAESANAAAPSYSAPVLTPDTAAVTSGGESSFSAGIFVAAAILGVILIGILGAMIYIFSGSAESKTPKGNDFVYSKDPDDDPPVNHKKTSDPTPKSTRSPDDPAPANGTDTSNATNNVETKDLGETAKSEQNAAAFLRKIAQNDPKAFITTEQAKTVNRKIKEVASTQALIDNINSARKNAAQIRSLAASKNLKPQFLAAAAISKLGNSRGDVLQTAQGMADIFAKLETQVGNERYDDALLMVAAFDQGAGGDFMKMRNMLQNVANQYPDSSRSIRSIWFLHDKGKITDAEFDFALRFLATGTITQNPKDFNVNCEALSL